MSYYVRRVRTKLRTLIKSPTSNGAASQDQAAYQPAFGHALVLDDYYPLDPVPRYGHGKPQHAAIRATIEARLPRYTQTLESFRAFMPQFLEIARKPDARRPEEPAWLNGFFPGLDTVALFGLLSTLRPKRFLEIGSGNSTRVAAKAKRLNSPATEIISIDPVPRAEVDSLCDMLVREPLETLDLAMFDRLEASDILFVDGSHRVFQNSDVAVVFLEILPRLKPGIYIHLHDIFWPDDYPPIWAKRYYSEQYMLGLLLLFAPEQFEIVLPNAFISYYTELPNLFADLWHAPHLHSIERHGVSFWLRRM